MKIIAQALGLAMTIGLAACGGNSDNGGGMPAPTAAPGPTSTPGPTTRPTPSPQPPPGIERTAVILTTDFENGSLSTFPVADFDNVTLDRLSLNGDAVGRAYGKIVYVINRFGADNIQALDTTQEYETLWQCSVGNGANPHDFVKASESRGYVSLFDKGSIAVVNLNPRPDCSNFVENEIDLASLADADGNAEPDQMVLLDETLYASLELLDRNDPYLAPTGPGKLAIIDTATNQLRGSIALSGSNPFAETKGLQLDLETRKIAVAEVGLFGVLDGGIEWIDTETQTAEGYFITEEDLGGDVVDFVIVSETRAYAIVADPDFNNQVLRFDPSSGAVQAELLRGPAYLPDIEYDDWSDELLVASQDFESPGIRIFAGDDLEVTTRPIDTGLPPFNICLLD